MVNYFGNIEMLEDKTELWKWCKSKTGNAKKLALGLGVGAAFVSEMINGNKLVPPDMIKKISVITGIPARELRPDLWGIFKDG